MKRRHVLASAACLALAPLAHAAQVTQLTGNGAWTWFNDPRGIYDPERNRLYTGWVTNITNAAADTAQVQFASHDFATAQTTVLDLNSSFEADDHNNPAI